MRSIYAKPLTDAEIRRYHLWVSEQPCALCGTEGATQVAHYSGQNAHMFGKGMGRKVHHLLVMPLCCEEANGCHQNYDQHKIFEHIEDELTRGLLETDLAATYINMTLIAAANAGLFRIPAGR